MYDSFCCRFSPPDRMNSDLFVPNMGDRITGIFEGKSSVDQKAHAPAIFLLIRRRGFTKTALMALQSQLSTVHFLFLKHLFNSFTAYALALQFLPDTHLAIARTQATAGKDFSKALIALIAVLLQLIQRL